MIRRCRTVNATAHAPPPDQNAMIMNARHPAANVAAPSPRLMGLGSILTLSPGIDAGTALEWIAPRRRTMIDLTDLVL